MSRSGNGIAIVIVAAVADNGVIGRDNGLPFRQSSDLKRFKALTWGKPMVMGRKTFLSIGKALPGRTTIVVSRDVTYCAPGAVVTSSLERGLELARADALRRGADEIAVVGGTDIFTQAMSLADRLEITHVHTRPQGDAMFPPIEGAQWVEADRARHPAGPKDEADYSYVSYRRT